MEITHKGAVFEAIVRRSPREFDIEFSGVDAAEGRFSAWLPLAVIGAASWDRPAIWSLTDVYSSKGYTPPQGKDWSGVRDSSPSAIWAMFEVARRELEGEKMTTCRFSLDELFRLSRQELMQVLGEETLGACKIEIVDLDARRLTETLLRDRLHQR